MIMSKTVPVNLHQTAVFASNDRKIEPGEPLPDDLSDEDRKTLLATGFFGTPSTVATD
jgi:hypothetical protein